MGRNTANGVAVGGRKASVKSHTLAEKLAKRRAAICDGFVNQLQNSAMIRLKGGEFVADSTVGELCRIAHEEGLNNAIVMGELIIAHDNVKIVK